MGATSAKVVCPAGEQINGATPELSGCRCRLAHETIQVKDNMRSLQVFCCSKKGHQDCPTWRRFQKAQENRTERELERDVRATDPDQQRRPVRIG